MAVLGTCRATCLTVALLLLGRECRAFTTKSVHHRVGVGSSKLLTLQTKNNRYRHDPTCRQWRRSRHVLTTNLNNDNNNNNNNNKPSLRDTLAASVSQTANLSLTPQFRRIHTPAERQRHQIMTLLRIALPSVVIGVLSTLMFPAMAMGVAAWISSISGNASGAFAVLSQDSSQFVQNFLTVAGLLFSILVGQTFYFMYQQQEMVYYALFNEVTEAKSLLEQIALVCQGRSMYPQCLSSMQKYVQDDLKQLQAPPAVLLSARPVDDPLESIMYLTSVGVPSTVYETVRSLRQARAARLGALQRKLPAAHMGLLWILAIIELSSFPLLGAGTQTIGGYNILSVEGVLFGVMTAGIVLTLRVVGELWRPAGGAYNVDQVLSVMVSGLEAELQARMTGGKIYKNQQLSSGGNNKSSDDELANDALFPSGSSGETMASSTKSLANVTKQGKIQQQGPNVFSAAFGATSWVWQRARRYWK